MNDFQSAFEAGASQRIVNGAVAGVEHALVPNSAKLVSMEHLMERPLRTKGVAVLSDIVSFVEYTNKFKGPDTALYANQQATEIVAIFNHHSKDVPAWCDNTAVLKLTASPEWERFLKLSERKMTHVEFAEFIEDNIDYVSAKSLSAADLLSMAQNFRVKRKGSVECDEKLHNGLKKLIYIDDSEVKGMKDNSREVSFPPELEFKMRFFKGCGTYNIKAFLRYRVEDAGVKFFFKIPDPQGMVESAMQAVVDEVAKQIKLQILNGTLRIN